MKRHPGVAYEEVPYWYRRTVLGQIGHLLRKKICVVWAPNCTITTLRIALYRLCGLKVGKGTFIGMRASIIAPHDIEIGEHAIVGAQTLVNISVPANAKAVGVPCRILPEKAQ